MTPFRTETFPDKEYAKLIVVPLRARVKGAEVDAIGNQAHFLARHAAFDKSIQRERRGDGDEIGSFIFGLFARDDPGIDAGKGDALPLVFLAKDAVLETNVGGSPVANISGSLRLGFHAGAQR